MKYSSYQQFAVIRSATPEQFTEQLNNKIQELSSKNPNVRFSDNDPLCAYISYTESKEQAENLAEEYQMQGVNITCQDCPCFKPVLNENGTQDKRCKYGDCKFAQYGRTYKTTAACETMYQMIENGEIILAFREEA